MNDKPRRRKSALGDKGYYIVLFLCVAAIGISGYFLIRGLFAQPGGFGQDPATAVSGQAELQKQEEDIHRQDQAMIGQTEDDAKDTENEDAAETAAEEDDQDTEEPQVEQEPAPDEEAASAAAYVWPVEGTVDRDFSLEVFAYDATMGDWRTHDGLDIEAEPGATVGACAAGTVESVSTDDMLGVTVVVDHGAGLKSVYANLGEGVSVQEGDPVEVGTVLGTVGTSAIAESASPSHLHFAMTEYGVSVDPLNYLH